MRRVRDWLRTAPIVDEQAPVAIINRMKATTGTEARPKLRSAGRWIGVVTFALALHAGAVAAMAQRVTTLPDDEDGMLRWGIAAGIVVVVGIAPFLDPKRSHKG